MIGREAYQNPYVLAEWERALLGGVAPAPSRFEVVERLPVRRAGAEGTPLRAITRHVLGLFNGLPGARAWRRRLSSGAPPRRRRAIAPRRNECGPGRGVVTR